MRVAVYLGRGRFETQERPVPHLQPGDMLIRMVSCGLCGTDVHKVVHDTVSPPLVLGHEVAGTVLETGPAVGDFKPGDRVAVAHHVPCMECWECRHGHEPLCAQYNATNLDPGGFSEFVRIPEPNVNLATRLVPAGLPLEQAAFMEPMACCIRAMDGLFLPGDRLLIQGAGPVGLLFLLLAQAMGAGSVIVTDLVDFRLKTAARLGASQVLDARSPLLAQQVAELTGGKGVAAVVDTTGNPGAMDRAPGMIRGGGKLLLFAISPPSTKLSLDTNALLKSEIQVLTSYSSSPSDYGHCLDLMATGAVPVGELISHRFALDQLSTAVTMGHQAGASLKIMIQP